MMTQACVHNIYNLGGRFFKKDIRPPVTGQYCTGWFNILLDNLRPAHVAGLFSVRGMFI